MPNNIKQTSVEIKQENDTPDESVSDLVADAAAEAAEETKSEITDEGEVKSDEKTSEEETVIASPEGTKQSSTEEALNPEEIATASPDGGPRDDEEPEQPVIETSPVVTDDRPGKWYVVHTYSGHENKVAAALRQRIEAEHLEDKIIDILVPTQNKIEIKSGRKTEVKEKIFPGYILVKMVLDDTSWLAVRTIPGVTSFVGMGNKPTVIPDSEVATIIKYSQIEQPTFKQVFSADDTVRIADGPFAEMIGKVDSVDSERGKVRVLVSIFGRETPVELDFLQVQKI